MKWALSSLKYRPTSSAVSCDGSSYYTYLHSRRIEMTTGAIIMMILVLSVFFGGFGYLILRVKKMSDGNLGELNSEE